MPVPTGDFQDLPSWRELVIETALAPRRATVTMSVDNSMIREFRLPRVGGGLSLRR
jgi:hypothetical protein